MDTLKFHKFITKIKSFSLSNQEKADLRADFLNKVGVDMHPVSIFNTIYFVQTVRYAKLVAFSFLVFAIGITPFALAAEGSEPGDILYPIKLTFNEPIKESLKTIIPFKISSDDIRRQQSNDEYSNKQIGSDEKIEECEEGNNKGINSRCEDKENNDSKDNKTKRDYIPPVKDIKIETDVEVENKLDVEIEVETTTRPPSIKTPISKVLPDSLEDIPPPTTSPYDSIINN